MQCSNCGAENPEGFRFCNQCGTSQGSVPTENPSAGLKIKVRVCPNCGGLSPLDVWNCINCDEPLDVYSIQEVDPEMIKDLDEFDASKDLEERFKEPDKLPKKVKETIQSRVDQKIQSENVDHTRHYSQTSVSGNRYYAMQGIASLCKALATIVAVVAGIGVLVFMILLIVSLTENRNINFALIGIFSCAILGGFTHLVLRLMAEGISVFLDIQAHTRQAAVNTQETVKLLNQLLTKWK